VDRDNIPSNIIRAATDREDTPYDLSFAPLPSEYNPQTDNSNTPAIPADVVPDEEEFELAGSDTSSDASTIIVDLNNPTDGISQGLLRAWERNGEIRRSPAMLDQQTQTVPSPSPPRTPESFPGYYTPDYSPIAPGEIDFDPIDISLSEENFVDFEINQLLDYLSSEEFLDSSVDL